MEEEKNGRGGEIREEACGDERKWSGRTTDEIFRNQVCHLVDGEIPKAEILLEACRRRYRKQRRLPWGSQKCQAKP